MKLTNSLKIDGSLSISIGVKLRLSNSSISGYIRSSDNELIHLRTHFDSVVLNNDTEEIDIQTDKERLQ